MDTGLLWILASGSPRRRWLLTLFGQPFRVWTADVDETLRSGESPADYVLRLAECKARAVSVAIRDPAVIIAADTAVVDGDDILGKPVDERAAWSMLQRLRGRTHRVLTGLAVLRWPENVLAQELGCTQVPMRAYSEAEMAAYIASGDPFDKAGGYAIQHKGFHPVSRLDGCYANVVGLPLCHLARALRRLALPAPPDVPAACQRMLEYACPVYERVLSAVESPCL